MDPLAMDGDRMRALGHLTVDALVDWLTDETVPPLRRATPAEMAARLGDPPPAGGEPYAESLARLFRDVLPYTSRSAHPAFFAYVPFAGTWPGALGDLVASACNVYAGSWQEAAGPTQLELDVLDWFKDWLGFPRDAVGVLVSGGSAANLTALAAAREALVGPMRDDVVVYVSDQAHSSIARAARVLGFRPEQVRVLPVAGDLRLEPATVAAAMDADEAAGRTPFVVVANAGATSTGAIDPIGELAELAHARGTWLHVDGAYGAFAALTERGRNALGPLGAADSLTLDPHKWLYQPYECGALLVRDGAALHRAFRVRSDYLRDSEATGGEVNFSDLGLQLSRSSRALKLWLSLRTFGLDAFRAAIDGTLDLAELARGRIEASPRLELVAPPSLGIVCFRRTDLGDDAVDGLVAALEESGIGLVSSTRVHGRRALRLCVLNHTTRAEDVERVLDFLAGARPASASPGYERDATVDAGVPLFARLTKAEREAVASLSTQRRAADGDVLVERWDSSRELYVLEEGAAEVRVNGVVVGVLRAPDHFGEIAALEWGSGFARSRAATVVARGDVVLRVLPPDAVAELTARFPRLDAELRAGAHARLLRAR